MPTHPSQAPVRSRVVYVAITTGLFLAAIALGIVAWVCGRADLQLPSVSETAVSQLQDRSGGDSDAASDAGATGAAGRTGFVSLELLAVDAATKEPITSARWHVGSDDAEVAQPYLSGTTGWAHVPAMRVGSIVKLRVRAEGYAESQATIEVSASPRPITLELHGTASVSGLVVDRETREPLVGASVRVILGDDAVETITDAKGRYALRRLRQMDAARVVCRLRGYSAKPRECALDGEQQVDFEMEHLDLISVTVEFGLPGPSGPTLDCPIAILAADNLVHSGDVRVQQGRGRLDVQIADATELRARVKMQGGAIIEATGQVFRSDDQRYCLLQFAESVFVAVRALGSDGPLANEVLAFFVGGVCEKARTDARGIAYWPALDFGASPVLWCKSGVSRPLDGDRLVASAAPYDVEFGDHGGRILVETDKADSLRLEVRRGMEAELAYQNRIVEGGRLFFVPAGDYALRIDTAPVPGQTCSVKVGEQCVLQLDTSDQRGGIFGVADPGAKLRLYRVTGKRRRTLGAAEAANDGVFQFQRLQPGEYLVAASADGRAAVSRAVTVARGERVDAGMLLADELLQVRGRLIDADGTPIAKRRLFIKSLPTHLSEESVVKTDANGVFVVENAACEQLHISSEGFFCMLHQVSRDQDLVLRRPNARQAGDLILPKQLRSFSQVIWITKESSSVAWGEELVRRSRGRLPRPVATGRQALLVGANGVWNLLEFDGSAAARDVTAVQAAEHRYRVDLPTKGVRWRVCVEEFGGIYFGDLKWRYLVQQPRDGHLPLRIPSTARLRVEAWKQDNLVGVHHVRN